MWSVDLLEVSKHIIQRLRDHAAECRQARPQDRTRLRGRDGAGCGPESAPGRRTPKSKWPRVFRLADTRGELQAACSAFGGHFEGEMQGAGAILGPKAPEKPEKWPRKARTDKRRWKSAVLGGFERCASESHRERSWPDARIGGGVGLAAACRVPHLSRAPPPEARSARGRRARLIAAKNPADLLAESLGRRQRRASASPPSSRAASEFHPSPAVDAVGVTAARWPSPVRRPRHATLARLWRVSGGAVAEAGAVPEWRNAPRGGGSDGVWKERGHRVSRATRSGARGQRSGAKRRAKGEGKAAARGRERRGSAAQRGLEEGRTEGGKEGPAQGGKRRRVEGKAAQRGKDYGFTFCPRLAYSGSKKVRTATARQLHFFARIRGDSPGDGAGLRSRPACRWR